MDESEARQTETQLELPDIRDWSLKERLRLEKESLGFYVSGHPLDQYASDVKALATSSADILTGIHKEGDNVSIAGIVVEKTIRLTKNSEKLLLFVSRLLEISNCPSIVESTTTTDTCLKWMSRCLSVGASVFGMMSLV